MTAIWWIRRDLRLNDNLTLRWALESGRVLPVYVIDPYFGVDSPSRRKQFLTNNLRSLDADLRQRGSYLTVLRGNPKNVLAQVLGECGADAIYAEEDFSPYAKSRDSEMAKALPLHLVQGGLVHHPSDIHKADGNPYSVYTPFSKVWKRLLPQRLETIPAPVSLPSLRGISSEPIPEYPQELDFPAGETAARNRLRIFLDHGIYAYAENRNRMDINGTAAISPYLHFGILGLRAVVEAAREAIIIAPDPESKKSAQTWLSELIWREFYVHILYHYPQVRTKSFRAQYDQIQWKNSPDEFEDWKTGFTGYPVVDAGMREMLATGWMHNRARMITASFLVKDLLIDWRWGERFFMENLLDGDLAANNGGWQWTAGTGTDAAPYFRVFNPVLQGKRFDPQGDYIRKWVPELAHLDAAVIHEPWIDNLETYDYPAPIVDHAYARERALDSYRDARGK